MDALFEAIAALLMGVVVPCTLFASIRLAIYGGPSHSANRILHLISRDEWCISLLFLLPMLVGDFARGETSPLPWVAFTIASARHGFIDGLLGFVLVLVAELWLLWIPAHLYVTNRPSLERRTVVFARCLNLAVGLLLLTPHNPIYALIASFPSTGEIGP